MDRTAEELLEETETWRDRLETALPEAEALSDQGQRFMTNIEAYVSDSRHFEANDDPIRAFEAIVWAWAWLEIGAETGDIDWDYPESWDGPDRPH